MNTGLIGGPDNNVQTPWPAPSGARSRPLWKWVPREQDLYTDKAHDSAQPARNCFSPQRPCRAQTQCFLPQAPPFPRAAPPPRRSDPNRGADPSAGPPTSATEAPSHGAARQRPAQGAGPGAARSGAATARGCGGQALGAGPLGRGGAASARGCGGRALWAGPRASRRSCSGPALFAAAVVQPPAEHGAGAVLALLPARRRLGAGAVHRLRGGLVLLCVRGGAVRV